MGVCKNFNYKARPDGGFDCVTELTSAGEIIESLKATSKSFYDNSTTPPTLKKEDEVEAILKECAKLVELKNSSFNKDK